MTEKKLIIVDASSLMFRAFYAVPPLKSKDGEISNAVFGFISIFLKMIKDFKPDFITVVHDTGDPTFRHQEFADYKANRIKTPEDLIRQIPKIREFVDSLNIKSFEKQGFEADDVIGTISSLTNSSDVNITIISNDKDTLQLVDKKISVCVTKTKIGNIIYNREKVIERYQGVTPEQFADFRALVGDSSDNIPGVFGIGEKTAIKLINQFKNIENLYKSIELIEIESGKAKLNNFGLSESIIQKLIKDKKNAFFSKKLSQIRKDIDINFDLKETSFSNYDFEKAKNFIEKLGFKSFIPKLPNYSKEIDSFHSPSREVCPVRDRLPQTTVISNGVAQKPKSKEPKQKPLF